MVSETKVNYYFPTGQFLEGCSSPSRLDRSNHGGGIMLYIREDNPFNLISSEKLHIEGFSVE